MLLNLLPIFNFFGLIYLTFLFYKKTKSIKPASPSSSVSAPPVKINLTRFNPFTNLGGDQSFILVLLDNTNSGVIITSLHNRDHTRVYSKSIKNGQSQGVSLSQEEKRALAKTIKS